MTLETTPDGDIRGALGTIASVDEPGSEHAGRGLGRRLRTLLAVLGPGLIVMVGDNDAGAFGTYSQAGQNYGTALLWTLPLLIPVLFVNQEMVLRLGAVTGVGHARLILQRYGRFWGAFSVVDLFVLNALTIVTEFIGISLGLEHLGVPKGLGIGAAALAIVAAASTGDFRRFERIALALVAGSLLLVPVFVFLHPPLAEIARDTLVPRLPPNARLGEVMLLIVAIVGTTVAPWQLFFQQSYVIDKRITPRFLGYGRVDLWVGIAVAIAGAVAMMSFAAAAFAGTADAGAFRDVGAVADGIAAKAGRLPGILFSLALIDASVIGACAVSLSSAYALGDVLSVRHSLHRKPGEAKLFYAVYAGLIAVAALLVLSPGAPLGLLTNLVQALAGVLLPSATVFLLLLCNDRELLGPWVNSRTHNALTAFVIVVLVTLSLILTVSVIDPDIGSEAIVAVLGAGGVMALLAAAAMWRRRPSSVGVDGIASEPRMDPPKAHGWRVPLATLGRAQLTTGERAWMLALRAYLLVAVVALGVKLVQVA